MSISSFGESIDVYARGKLWYWYLPLWLFSIYIFVELFQFNMASEHMPLVLLVPYSFDFLLHELAHIFTALFPAALTASAGSVSELLLGTILVVMAFWQRSYFASLFCLLWFALTCQSAGQYMADAIPERIPLVSLGGALSGQDPVHDWHFVFGQLHLLNASYFIGNSVRFVGMSTAGLGILFAAWLLYRMAATPELPRSNVEPAAPSRPSKPATDEGFTSYALSELPPAPKGKDSGQPPVSPNV